MANTSAIDNGYVAILMEHKRPKGWRLVPYVFTVANSWPGSNLLAHFSQTGTSIHGQQETLWPATYYSRVQFIPNCIERLLTCFMNDMSPDGWTTTIGSVKMLNYVSMEMATEWLWAVICIFWVSLRNLQTLFSSFWGRSTAMYPRYNWSIMVLCLSKLLWLPDGCLGVMRVLLAGSLVWSMSSCIPITF